MPTASSPSKPRPITATRSPSCGSARRKPCRAIAPRVVKAPDSKSTVIGQVRQQVLRDEGVLGMHGIAPAGAGDPVADLEALHTGADGDDRAGGGIAQRHGLVEAVEGGFDGGQQAFAAGLIEHLAHQVGPRAGFADQAFFGEFDQHALGTGGDERGGGVNQRGARSHDGNRHIGDDGLSVLEILQELFHNPEL